MRRTIPIPNKSTLLVLAALAALPLLSACGGSEPAPAVAERTPAPVVAVAPEPAPPVAVPAPLPPQPFTAGPATIQPASSTRDFRAEAAKYIGYYNSYRLTPDQEEIKNTALTRMPAPCCDDNTMATCCCPCNMAKAVWGLSAHLIVEEGYDADRLEKTVRGWLADANPNGFSGQACYKGGCTRSFDQDGCGGMIEGYVF